MKTTDTKIGLYFVAFLLLYFLFEACFFSFISPGAGLDDAELISNISFWSWGYGGSQPPLYTWIAYGLTSVFGLHFWLLQLLRFALLASVFLAVYIGLRLLQLRESIAVFAALSIFLLPQIAWESQRALIHSVLGTAGCAWSFAAFLWFARKPDYRRALLLGLSLAAAVLGKYNALIFIIALFAAASCFPVWRRAFKTRFFIAALSFAFILILPALLFMALHPYGVIERANKFQMWGGGDWFYSRLCGLLSLFQAAMSFVLPAVFLAAVIGGAALWKNGKQTAADRQAQALLRGTDAESLSLQRAVRFLRLIILWGLLVCGLMVLLSGATHVKDRWLQPVLLLSAPYLALCLMRIDISARSTRIFGCLGVVAALAIPPMLYANLYLRAGSDKPAVQNLDYPMLYAGLRSNGDIATILSPYPFYSGNIRLLNPHIKTLFAETPQAVEHLQRPLVILWKTDADFPQKLLPIIRQAGLNEQEFPTVQSLQIPYRIGFKVKQSGGDMLNDKTHKSEQIYYIYLP